MYPCASRVVVELDEIHPQVAVRGRTHVGVQHDGLEDRSRTWRSIWSNLVHPSGTWRILIVELGGLDVQHKTAQGASGCQQQSGDGDCWGRFQLDPLGGGQE